MFIVIAVRHKYAFRADADDAGFFDTVKLLGRVRFRSGEDGKRRTDGGKGCSTQSGRKQCAALKEKLVAAVHDAMMNNGRCGITPIKDCRHDTASRAGKLLGP